MVYGVNLSNIIQMGEPEQQLINLNQHEVTPGRYSLLIQTIITKCNNHFWSASSGTFILKYLQSPRTQGTKEDKTVQSGMPSKVHMGDRKEYEIIHIGYIYINYIYTYTYIWVDEITVLHPIKLIESNEQRGMGILWIGQYKMIISKEDPFH